MSHNTKPGQDELDYHKWESHSVCNEGGATWKSEMATLLDFEWPALPSRQRGGLEFLHLLTVYLVVSRLTGKWGTGGRGACE